MRALSFVILLFLSSSALADDREKLLGNWKVISLFTEDVQTKRRSNVFGEHPNGFIGFTPERFFGVLMAEGRKAPQTVEEQAGAYRTVVAYTGKWRLEGEKFITKVDAAWNPGWVGTDQIRFWRADGNKLFITTAPTTMPNPDGTERTIVGTVVWEREQ
jgi:Lipocalin-like domain